MDANELGWLCDVRTWWRDVAGESPPLSIVDTAMHGLFEVGPFSGVTISTDQAAGISLFAGISPAQYLRLCGALGLTQWRTLELNETLVAEDFAHTDPRECLFVQRPHKSDYALALEQPSICSGCFEFYHCLGADAEIVALAEMLKSLQNARPGSRLGPVLR